MQVVECKQTDSRNCVVTIQTDDIKNFDTDLESPQARQMAVEKATAILGSCGVSSVSGSMAITANGRVTELPTPESLKEFPVIGYQKDFRCLQKV